MGCGPDGRGCLAIESIFYILERQPSDTILDGGNTHDGGIGEDWILLNWSLPIRHLKADNSPILYLEAVEAAVKKLLGVRNTVVFVSSVVSSSRLVRQLCSGQPVPAQSTHNTRDQL